MQKLRHRATKPYCILNSLIICFLYCDLAGTFNVLTYMDANYHVADTSTTSKSYDIGLRSTLNLPLALMGLHTLIVLFPL